MKRKYILPAIILVITCCLIYLSSIYLVKAEYSFRDLQQKTEELQKETPQGTINQVPPAMANTVQAPEEKIETAQAMPPVNNPVPIQKAVEEKPIEPSGPTRISMDFVNANLKDVLKIFCQQSKLNFIAGENVELKQITLYLNNVSIEDALNSIISANGLTYERAKGSDVFIVRKTGEPETKVETKIFKLNYAFAEDTTVQGISPGAGATETASQTVKGIKETVRKLLTPNGDLSVDARTNSLIVTDIPSRLASIEKSIQDLDSQLPQILIEAKIVELGSTDLQQLGIKWTSLANYQLGYHSPVRTLSDTKARGRNISDGNTYETANDTEIADELVSNPKEGTSSETVTTTSSLVNNLGRSLTDTLTRSAAKSDISSAILSADDFTVTLSLLLTDNNVDIVSSPNIVTTHGKEAKITVGEKYPIPQYSFNTSTSTWEVQGFEYKDIGILLRVIPYAAKKDENITIEVHPEVSSITDYVNFGGAGGAKIPIISTREATTNVAIRDGDTLAIGGLLKDKDDTTIVKVPLLGDLPFLGNLFRHKEATKSKSNLIIFITPHILKNGRLPPNATSEAVVKIPMVIPVENQAATPAPQAASSPDKNTTKTDKTNSKNNTKSKFTHR